jgi:hypothetical protein
MQSIRLNLQTPSSRIGIEFHSIAFRRGAVWLAPDDYAGMLDKGPTGFILHTMQLDRCWAMALKKSPSRGADNLLQRAGS